MTVSSTAASCHGNGATHCCNVDGSVCPFLEEHTVPGRRWVCGLRRELGTWEAVDADPRWQQVVGRSFLDPTRGSETFTCGSWPWALGDDVLDELRANGTGAPGLCCFGDVNPAVPCEEADCGH